MVVGILTVELSIPGADNLKAKRAVLNKIKDRAHHRFNVSIAEVEANDVWNFAVLGCAVVSNDQRHANQVLSKVEDFIESIHDCIVDDVTLEFVQA